MNRNEHAVAMRAENMSSRWRIAQRAWAMLACAIAPHGVNRNEPYDVREIGTPDESVNELTDGN
jgi:hypothetical protein